MPVVSDGQLAGIVTHRDMRFETELDDPVRHIMTKKDRLITVKEGAASDEVLQLLHRNRIEKVLVVNDSFELRGLITVKDIQKNTFQRCQGPVDPPAGRRCRRRGWRYRSPRGSAGRHAWTIVVDTAHGHSQGVLDRVSWVKKNFPACRSSVATSAAKPHWRCWTAARTQ